MKVDSMNKLAHEFRVPVVAFRAALERLQYECRANRYTFQFDHFEELWTYCDVMKRLLLELDAVRKGIQSMPLVPKKTHFFTQIIPPAVRFVKPLLQKKKLKASNIKYQEELHKTLLPHIGKSYQLL